MASSINAILNIGAGALFANQAAIQTTGNNIANVNTEGYSRQKVRFEEYPSLDYSPGQMGQGVRAAEVYRMFDRFVEKAYLNKASQADRWETQTNLLQSVESLFNESNSPGIASAMQKFFDAWNDVYKNPASSSSREALLSYATTLAGFVRETDAAMQYMQSQMDTMITQDVGKANTLMKEIASLNLQINAHSIPGSNNPNTLMDQRDLKVRELATLIDIDVIDRGEGHYTITTAGGKPLVEEGVAYSLFYSGAASFKDLKPGSAFDGDLGFVGNDEYEYTLEVVTGGDVNDTGMVPAPAGTAMFRVSLDGGKSWLKDDNGNDMLFPANSEDTQVQVKDLQIYFSGATQPMAAGDKFTIVPKSGLYWVSPTIGVDVTKSRDPIQWLATSANGLENITPQTAADGTENSRRVTGGSIGAYFDFRDNQLGQYRERLDAFAQALTWEVNRIHSQGVGLEKLDYALGTYKVQNTTVPLGSGSSGLVWADRLQAGNITIAMYDKTTGDPVLKTDGTQAMLDVNFDPAVDSLDDLVTRINGTLDSEGNQMLTASIVDGRLQVASTDPTRSFAFAADTSGLLAGLGINTFFDGEHASKMAVRDDVRNNTNLINAGRVNGGAEANSGDNITALEMAQLANKAIKIGTATQKATSQTLVGYYATIVSKVGGDTAAAKYNTALYGAMAQDLSDRQDESSGVNLDEEMTNLVKFQNSYKAAAKLITTADQMLQTLLSLKQ